MVENKSNCHESVNKIELPSKSARVKLIPQKNRPKKAVSKK